MKRWITALIALIIGVIIGYAYKQGEVSSLTQQLAALKTEVSDANAAATAQIDELKTELEAKSKLAEEQQAETPGGDENGRDDSAYDCDASSTKAVTGLTDNATSAPIAARCDGEA
jgi:hypothetical protein